ncbi:hypothetical protein [Bacillus toyonensis]|uniref:Uncharacterized protein n=1 Tax=Bacillus toyonensis TaxID=155322 RepID=A0A2A8H7X4_9BACI|nr:hypothetical protein [Bacillus toyonensis]PEP89081.1 hypothetical protein CN585_28830 [Bacillus toyonensis]
MKAYKKIIKIAPVAVLSTTILLSPTSILAAENAQTAKIQTNIQKDSVAPQERVLQGYLFKNGVQTPIYKGGVQTRAAQLNEAPYPELPSNPNDPYPEKGSVASENGNVGSTLYFSTFEGTANVYIEKVSDSQINIGCYNPNTLERSTTTSLTKGQNDQMDKRFQIYQSFFNGTTVKRETAFEKIASALQNKTDGYQFSQGVSSGLSKTDAIGFSFTMGWKWSITAGGGAVVPASMTEEFSASLTSTYTHTIAVTSQTTNTQTITHPKPADTYKHDKYRAVVYQLNSIYTIVPGDELSKVLTSGIAVLSQKSFKYSDSDIYLAVTPGS